MLEEATRTIATSWNAEEPVSLDGRYPLHGAQLLPRPVQRPAPILIGGGSLRAADIAARWATGWNGTGDRAVIAKRIAQLREREARYGRTGQVETSVMLSPPPTGFPAARPARGNRRAADRAVDARFSPGGDVGGKSADSLVRTCVQPGWRR